jgi:LCP family protein required for cell wall assembly
VLVVVLLWIVYLVAVPIFAWQNVEKVAWEPGGDRPGDQPGTTYLMVGSDSRAGLSEEERKELGTGSAAGNRTDTIMLLHTGDGPNLLMSIPRDSPYDGGKINAAYSAGGPEGLVSAVEGLTGIRVDEYVEIGMGGVVGIVDAVGGIEICPKKNINDPKAKLNIKKGCQEADGKTALGYSRSRASALSDLDRVQQQREVVSAIGSKVVSPWSVINPVRYWRLNNALPDFFVFGEGMGPIRAGQWAMAMTKVNGTDGLTCTVPLASGSAVWDEARSQEMFQAVIEDDTDAIGKDLCTPSGLPPGVGPD